MKKRGVFLVSLILLISFAVIIDAQSNETNATANVTANFTEDVVCAADVKECPDGSFVSRDSNNNCEFYPCPEQLEEELVCCAIQPVVAEPPPTIFEWRSEPECDSTLVGVNYEIVDNNWCEETPPVQPDEPEDEEDTESTTEEPEPEPRPEKCAGKIKVKSNKKLYYIGDDFEITVEVFDEQGNLLPDYPFYSQMYDDRWHSVEKEHVGRDGNHRYTGKVGEGGADVFGKIKFKIFTRVTDCEDVEDILELEIKKGEDKEEVCGIGVCVPEEENGEIKEIPEEERALYSCSGCVSEDKCYPMGYRKEGSYCSDDYEFVSQVEGDMTCDNNFECKSNVCVSGECIGESLIKKILAWFKKLFGGEEGPEEPGEEICKKLLIKKDIGDYEYFKSAYGHAKESQAPLYTEEGQQIGIVKCCVAGYLEPDGEEKGTAAIVCPYDNREDVENSIKWLLAREELSLGEYKGQEVAETSNAIIWTAEAYIVGTGVDPHINLPLPEEIADAYLKKYNNDLDVDEIPDIPSVKGDKEFLAEIEELGEVTLIDFETLPDGTVLEAEQRLTGGEWQSLGVVFDTPSEEYLKLFGPWHPFNPLDELSLSPGFGPYESGSDTHDDLTITFSQPVKAAGVYLLDLGETDERESITFLDKNGRVIEKISPWPKSTFGNPAPGTFVSLIHDGISKIEIKENTQDGDDIAYDNLYFVK